VTVHRNKFLYNKTK